ncbi:glycoside hydrolase family 31 protein [Butyrivibrio sp. NC3005]|uniref:glycoside hydrolase family 31 protein n=1 Tax=Butyrivibrio sp. NC3005 TaxID=1280685 RepID=UPI000419CFF7|nr:TIM-barrel domain-containing protein [Butyrivibrio sp. NC3005]
MFFSKEDGCLVVKGNGEKLRIEPWGKDAFRVRSTMYPEFTGKVNGLEEEVDHGTADIQIKEDGAVITNGILSATINFAGVITFYRKGEKILREYFRSYGGTISKESSCLKLIARNFKPIIGGDYKLTMRFESNDGEKLFGMGCYQQEYMDLKGCILELAQRNSQTSIPFVMSNKMYGFLWNSPAVGSCLFGKNFTEWIAECTKELDYWIVAGENPKDITMKYTSVTGRAPVIRDDVFGLWQSRLRYRTQDEVLSVVRRYKELGIKLDVIVIDFFHWTRQGDWQFDPEYWPDPKAMIDEIHSYGTKVIVSVWPTVDKKSIHYGEMLDKGYLMRVEHGSTQAYDFQGDCMIIDCTNPEARQYLWNICKKNYYDYGIDMFWLDNAEPDLAVYDYENFRYYMGTALSCSNVYPKLYAKAFFDGQKECGNDDVFSLIRCGWVGCQKYGTLLWNGDVQSNFETLKDSVAQGQNMGIVGIPWWNTDVAGFMNGNMETEEFKELLQRWFEFAVFCPILRLHGDREPFNIPVLDDTKDWGGGYLHTGAPTEMWACGDEVFEVLRKNLELREKLKPYIQKLNVEAHETGLPLIRAMFYEFPEDEKCWNIQDQYFFGDEYLVCPVVEENVRERTVYLPEGKWEDIRDGRVYEGNGVITASAPIDSIPVYKRR